MILFGSNHPHPHPSLDGFEHIKRFWDAPRNRFIAKILPGQYYVTQHREVIATILGSCISVCACDRKAGVGGMNHFLLPHSQQRDIHNEIVNREPCARYGIHAMDMLLLTLLKHGAKPHNIEVKVTGGGRIISSMSDIGAHNIAFIREYIEIKKLNLIAEDVGDIYPRKVLYYPDSGKLLVKKLDNENGHVIQRENRFLHKVEDGLR